MLIQGSCLADGSIVGKTIEGTVMRKIKRNCIQCKHCGDIIASEHRYDYKSCKCGCVAVDGGRRISTAIGKKRFRGFY